MIAHHDLAALDRLKTRIQGLRSKTTDTTAAPKPKLCWPRRRWRSCSTATIFFGLRSDFEVAHYLTEVIDNAVRSELGRYKVSAEYRRFRHQDRHLANSSFTLGMVASIVDKLTAMKTERDALNIGTGRDLVILKAAVIGAELEKLDLKLRKVRRAPRLVSPEAYEAGEASGASLAINLGIRHNWPRH